jgi:uncharacterized DUF497 family protein
MDDIHFQWDEKKEALNKKKHSTSFTEAQTVFADENGLLLPIAKIGLSFSV